MQATHPTDVALRDFLLGKLPDGESDSVEAHLSECPECLGRAADEPVHDTLVELLTSAHTRLDQDRAAAVTPLPDLLSTPSVGAVTHSYLGPAPGDPAATTPPPELAGHPKYRVLGPLGCGGMGTVWLAEHTVMGRNVALKAVRPEWVARPGSAERFQREVRAAAKLKHENIATAYDAEQVGDRHFLVMEYVPGEPLSDVVRRGPLPAIEACRAVRDAARGLAHAHTVGLVHRDVKPGNLIRTPDETTKVLDFGLVSAAEPEDAALTGENLVMGTPDYIAPEQAADPHLADARSDIYALGCTLYHLLAGRVPYPGDSVLKKIDAHRDPAVRPASVPGVSPALTAVMGRMMAKDPRARFQSAADVATALEPFVSGAGPGPAMPRRRSVPGWVVAAGLVFAVVGLSLAGVVVKIQRDNEVLTVTTDDPDIEVAMKRNGDLVRIMDAKTGKAWELDTKKLRLTPDGGELSIDLPGREPLVLRRNGRAVVTVRQEAGAGAAADAKSDEVLAIRATQGLGQALALSADGRFAFTGNGIRGGSSASCWDLQTGKLVREFSGHADLVHAAALSPDGTQLLTGSYDGTARLWDVATGREVKQFVIDRKAWVLRVLFTPDGKQAVVSTNVVRVLDLADGKERKRFDMGSAAGANIQALALSADGKYLAAGNHDGDVRVWEFDSGKLAKQFRGHVFKTMVYQVAFSPDGKTLLSAATDRTARLWDIATGDQRLRVEHAEQVNAAAFSPDGKRFSTGGHDKTVRVWETATGREVHRFVGHELPVWAVPFTPDGKHIVSASNDPTLRVWKLPESPTPLVRPSADPPEATLPLKPGEVFVFRRHTDGLLALAVSPDGKYAVTGGSWPNNKDSTMRMWDLGTGEEVKQFRGHTNYIYSAAFSRDGKRLISGSQDFTARVWDVAGGKELMALDPPGIGAGVAFLRDGKHAVVTTEKARLFDLTARKDLDRFGDYRCYLMRSLALSPDESTLATGDSFGDDAPQIVSLWDVKTGKRITGLGGGNHVGMIYAVAWSPDGKLVASAGGEGTVVIWSPDRGRSVMRFEHPGWVLGVAYSPGGKFLLTGCQDHAVRVWDAESGKEVLTLKGHDQPVWTVAFTPDGTHALSVSQDKTMRMWRLPDALVDPKRK